MDITIKSGVISGTITPPPSKSISHRALICAALADGTSTLTNLLDCDDITATSEALTALGAEITTKDGITRVTGIKTAPEKAHINCRESGSTLRFLLPIAAAEGVNAVFSGYGKLPQRPINSYFTEFSKYGIIFHTKEMPYEISGRLRAGTFSLAGNISSQFVTGLMLALPLCGGDSAIEMTSPLESEPYVDITISVMKAFGVLVEKRGGNYYIKGDRVYKPCDFPIEADMSQAAFWLVAKALGNDITAHNLAENSVQGDRAIIDIVRAFEQSGGKAFDTDARQIPDLVPILAVLACFADGTSHITGCERLKIKESDRLSAISSELNRLGADITATDSSLIINGVKKLHGGVCESHNDHRIAMALAIASTRADAPITITGAECVKKSYPTFWKDFGAE